MYCHKGKNYRLNTTDKIEYEFEDQVYRGRCRKSDLDGICRERKLNLRNLIFIILDFKTSIQRELDKFFKAVDGADFNIRKVTKGAFFKARQLLDPYAFSRLNEVPVDVFYEQAPYYNWLGHSLLACDGSRLVLPNHETTKRDFGQYSFGPKADSPKTLALCSILYDPLHLISIDA